MPPANQTRVRLRALDGSQVDVEGLDAGGTAGWGFRAWFTTRRTGASVLASTKAGAHEHSPLPDAKIVSEAKAGGARLLAFADPGNKEHPTTTFVYQDRHHELSTTQAGSGIPLDRFVDFLKPLDISDSPEGIQAVPKKGADATVELHLGASMIPDVAVLTTFFTAQALKDVPSSAGQQARGGMLWKLEDRPGVLLANESTATTIDAVKQATDPRFVSLAQSLRIVRSAR
jgi:hypothetical protein